MSISKHRLGRERGRDALLVVVALGAYPVEELAAGAEVEAEVEVVCRLWGARARRESAFGIRYSAFRNQHSEFSIERSAFSISALSFRHSALRARTVRVDARNRTSTRTRPRRKTRTRTQTHLEVVVQGDDVAVALGDLLEDCNLVAHLSIEPRVSVIALLSVVWRVGVRDGCDRGMRAEQCAMYDVRWGMYRFADSQIHRAVAVTAECGCERDGGRRTDEIRRVQGRVWGMADGCDRLESAPCARVCQAHSAVSPPPQRTLGPEHDLQRTDNPQHLAASCISPRERIGEDGAGTEVRGSRLTMYSLPSMSFLLMTLQA